MKIQLANCNKNMNTVIIFLSFKCKIELLKDFELMMPTSL